MSTHPDLSVVIVSYNGRETLRACLRSLSTEIVGLRAEVFVVDNASRDGSAAMVATDFPSVRLLANDTNLGFAAANNQAFRQASGRYVVLLNPDAFLSAGALRRAVERMDAENEVALGGARLVGEDGSWQPSARRFPSVWTDILSLTGLAARFPDSRLFGSADRTWADPAEVADIDWVPGAFAIIRRSVLEAVGLFDERFFLYYEEVDLCRRIKAAGHTIRYWPDVVVVHRGGESARSHSNLQVSRAGSQVTAWRMRSAFLYYRKHSGLVAALASLLAEAGWHGMRAVKNRLAATPERRARAAESRRQVELLWRAWTDTQGGLVSPARPW